MEKLWLTNGRKCAGTGKYVERVIILSEDGSETITPLDLPEKFHALPEPKPPSSRLDLELPDKGRTPDDSAVSEFEKNLILQALTKTGWVKNKPRNF